MFLVKIKTWSCIWSYETVSEGVCVNYISNKHDQEQKYVHRATSERNCEQTTVLQQNLHN
jgi:hypothetical protein